MIKINGEKVDTFKFSGGEVHPKIEGVYPENISVKAFIRNADDIMELLLVKNALDQMLYFKRIDLVIPYVPYARQDRVCNAGEAFSIKVMCDLINSMNFNRVTIYDPHSDVTPALINNCRVVPQEEIFSLFKNMDMLKYTLVSPDAGAEKKVHKVSEKFDGLQVIYAGKIRNTKTGEIVATKVDWGYSLKGKDILIVDDICDGGRTFIEIAKKLHRFKPQSINLYVTHGIFSKGYEPLFEAGIKKIFTTDSFEQTYEVDGLRVVNL